VCEGKTDVCETTVTHKPLRTTIHDTSLWGMGGVDHAEESPKVTALRESLAKARAGTYVHYALTQALAGAIAAQHSAEQEAYRRRHPYRSPIQMRTWLCALV
jgi:hypothetical protein